MGVWALCVAALVAAGCRDRAPNNAAVEFWAMGREGEVVERLMPEFARRHPGVRVRVQQVPWSAAHEKLLTAFVGGVMPDVFQVGNTWLPEFAALEAVQPLDARMAASAAVPSSDFFPGVFDTNVIAGATYGIPWYVDTRVLFYRSDILAEAGYATPPRDWASWLDAMIRIKTIVGPQRYAVLLPFREWQTPVILALQRGAVLLRDGERYGNFRSPAFRAAFEFYLELFRRDLAPRTGEAQVANLYQDFSAGFFSFYVTGPWNIGEFNARLPAGMTGKWATAPLPAPEGGDYPGVSLAGGASLAISAGSRQQDGAWKLIEYLSAPERQVEFYRLTGDLPARRSAWDDAVLAGSRYARAFETQLAHVRSTPKIPEWERIAATITRHCESAIRGEQGVVEALAALDQDVDAVLEKRRWLLRRRADDGAERTPVRQ